MSKCSITEELNNNYVINYMQLNKTALKVHFCYNTCAVNTKTKSMSG